MVICGHTAKMKRGPILVEGVNMDEQTNTKARQASQMAQDMHDFHQEAWEKLDELERWARQLAGEEGPGGDEALKNIREAIAFIDSGLSVHFRQEEEQVYAFLKQRLPASRRRSVAAMEKDHLTLRAHVNEVKGLLRPSRSAAKASAGQSGQAPEASLRLACLRLVRMMRKHITKENLLYQALEQTT